MTERARFQHMNQDISRSFGEAAIPEAAQRRTGRIDGRGTPRGGPQAPGPWRTSGVQWTVSITLVIVALATVLRLGGITREPFWLDEIFAFDFTSGTAAQTLSAVARDVHPPAYFLGLQAWRSAFGSSEGILRGYSALWSIAGVLLVGALAWEVTQRRGAFLVAAFLAAVNPLDIYFAQETRMYAQAAALGALTSLLLLRSLLGPTGQRNAGRRWLLVGYTAAAGLLLLTHYIGITILLAQGLFALAFFSAHRRWRDIGRYCLSAVAVGLVFLPWLYYVDHFRSGLYTSRILSWIPPASLSTAWAVYARDILWGRPGLPSRWWPAAQLASVAILALTAGLLIVRARRREEDLGAPASRGAGAAFLAWMALAPVAIALLTSDLYHPVLYHPRFSVLVVPPVIALVAVAATTSTRRAAAMTLIVSVVAVQLLATGLQYGYLEKAGMRDFVKVWRREGPPEAVYFYPRWNRRVAHYYLHQRMPVLSRAKLEQRLREDRPVTIWACTNIGYQPDVPSGERQERDWLLSLGPSREVARVDRMSVVKVQARPVARTYPQLKLGAVVRFGSHDADRYLWSGWYGPERTFRWSRGTRAVALFSVRDAATRARALVVKGSCYFTQHVRAELNGTTVASFECSDRRFQDWRWKIPAGTLKEKNTLVLELPDAASPAELDRSRDTRKLAVGIASMRLE